MNYVKSIVALLLRLYFGSYFLTAGIGKWKTGFDEKAVTGFLKGALAKTSAGLLASAGPEAAAHPSVTDTWAWIIQHVLMPAAPVFAVVVKTGEVLIGLGLILGCFTLLATAFALFMNFTFLLSGTVSSNPQMILGFALILMLGSSSYAIGLDRFFLAKLTEKFPVLQNSFFKRFFPISDKGLSA